MNNGKGNGHKTGMLVFHKGLILVLAPLILEIILIGALALVLLQLDKESVAESRYRRCAAIGAHLVVLAEEAAVNVLAWFQSNSPELMKQYDHAIAGMRKEEEELKTISTADPLSRKSAVDLIHSIDSLTGLLDNVANLAKERRILEMAAVIPRVDTEYRAGKNTYLEQVGAVTSAQERIAGESTFRQDRLRYIQRQIIILGIIANLFLAVILFSFFKSNISNRLQVVRDNTTCLSENRPLAPRLSGSDEISRLDLAFHSMNADLKAAMVRERSLFDNASDVICVLNSDNNFERINQVCLKHWGFKDDELTGKSVLSIINEKKEEASLLFQSAKQEGEQALIELVIQKNDGALLETLWSTYWSDQENLLYCVVHDISERKRIERMKQSYLTMISSDLRIPLAFMAGAAEKLAGPLARELSQRALERVQAVKANLDRLLLLVNELLEMSELESGSLALNKELSPVEPLLQRSCRDLEGIAQKRRLQFAIKCQAGDCFLDPMRIMQVTVNLLSNAVKFSPEGGEITLCATADNEFLEVRIKDQGRGVSDSHKKAIFEKFTQVESADGKRSAGTGLGLPICKDIVEEHGGKIGVESEPGEGATFWFKLPLRAEVYERIVKANADETRQTKKTVRQSSLTPVLEKAAEIGPYCTVETKQGRFRFLLSGGSFMSLTGKGILLIVLPLIVEVIFVFSVLAVIAQVNTSRQEELKQRQIAADAYKILDAYLKMIVICSAAAREDFWPAYDECCRKEQSARTDMGRLLKGDHVAMSYFLKEEKISCKLDRAMATGRDWMHKHGYNSRVFDEIRPDRFVMIATSSAVSRRLSSIIDEAEQKQEITPVEQARLRRQQAALLLAGLAANIILALLAAKFFSKNITTRLSTLADNTTRLSRRLPLNAVIPGNDEIAQLDQAFHATAYKLGEARRKERAVFDNSRDLIAALDGGLCFVSCNPAAERMLGYTQDELTSKSLLDLIDPSESQRVKQLLLNESASATNTCETCVKTPEGSSAYLLWSWSRPQKEANIYCVAHDISDRKKLERLKQEFLSVVSHDLRNPLGSVVGFISLISAGALGEPGAPALQPLDEINQQADKLLSMINDLLDLEKLEARRLQMVYKRESAGLIAYRAFEAINAKYPDFNLQMAESNVELELDCDPDRLSQAFSNIYVHICKRAESMDNPWPQPVPAGAEISHPSITSSFPAAPPKIENQLLICFYESSGKITFEIRDPGPAYSEQEKQQLFERFKVDADSRLQGTGLALPVAKRIIEAHQGSLILEESSPGSWSFVICLPSGGQN